MAAKFNIDTISLSELCKRVLTKEIQIPKFQRNLVWNLNKKKALQNSIEEGIPIGVFILWTHESDQSSNFSIVDGLQRISTLIQIFINPFLFAEDEDIKDIIQNKYEELKKSGNYIDDGSTGLDINEVNQILNDIKNDKKIFSLINENIQVIFKDNKNNYYEFFQKEILIPVIEKQGLTSDKKKENFKEIFLQTYEEIYRHKLALDDYKVFYISFEAEKDKADEQIIKLFQNLNTGGTPLDHFDILKAELTKQEIGEDVTPTLNAFIGYESNRYFESIFEKYSMKQETDKPNLFDLIFYLFKQAFNLASSHINIFREHFYYKDDSEDENNVETIHNLDKLFNLIRYILWRKNENISWKENKEKAQEVYNYFDSDNVIKKTITRLKVSVEQFDEIFQYLILFNKKNKNKTLSNFIKSEAMMISILGNIYHHVASYGDKNIDSFELSIKQKKIILLKSVLANVREEYNSGSSEKGFEHMKNHFYLPSDLSKFDYEIINKEIIGNIENNFEIDKKLQKKAFSHKNIVVMNFIFFCKMSGQELKDTKQKYENDFLIPKLVLEKNKITGINNIGNLSILKFDKNRAKAAKLKNEFFEQDFVYELMEEHYQKLDLEKEWIVYKSIIPKIVEIGVNQQDFDLFCSLRVQFIKKLFTYFSNRVEEVVY